MALHRAAIRRLSPDVYLGVADVTRPDSRLGDRRVARLEDPWLTAAAIVDTGSGGTRRDRRDFVP